MNEWIQNFVAVHYLSASYPLNVKRKKKHGVIYIKTKEQHHCKYLRCELFYIPFSGPLSENRSQVGLSSTTLAHFRRKTYQKKTCCVPFLFWHFPKTWSPYDADNCSHDIVLKIAEIQSQVVSKQSREHSPQNVFLLKSMNFVLCSQESLAEDSCLYVHTADFRGVKEKKRRNQH